MAKYEIKRYNFETKKTIDIHKKEPKHKLSKKDITNLSLVALRRINLDFSVETVICLCESVLRRSNLDLMKALKYL